MASVLTPSLAIQAWRTLPIHRTNAQRSNAESNENLMRNPTKIAGGTVEMSEKDSLNRIWDIVEKSNSCMLTTQFTGGLRARPLEARPDRDAGLIFFVTDYHSDKENEIQARPEVGVVFIDSKDNAYLSITGRASVLRDLERTKAIWRKSDDVWWPGGPNDPKVCALQIEPIIGELWDGPRSRLVTYLEFAKAKLTGQEPNLGENRKVTVKM